jgi:dTDP-4-dehydrorhamnose reductase
MKKKLLITGASGFLGWTLCQKASVEWDVIGTSFSHTVTIPGISVFTCDITDKNAVSDLIASVKPDAIIHCAAASQPNWCEDHPEESYRINVDSSVMIARVCAGKKIPCVFTSTDLVFDGKHAPYKESSAVGPVNRYGEQKVLAEKMMKSEYDDVTICRLPLMFGASSPSSQTYLDSLIKTLRSGETAKLFVDEIRTIACSESVSDGLILALAYPSEIFHLGGRERISRYDFGLTVARILGVSSACIEKAIRKDIPMMAPRPADVSFDSQKAYAIGFDPKTVEQELRGLANMG